MGMELNMISTNSPAHFPPATKIPSGYRVDANGLWVKRGDKEDSWQQVASTPVWVEAIGRDGNAEDWSVAVGHKNPDGDIHRLIVSYGDIIAKGSSLVQDVSGRGLLVLPMAEMFFRDFLAKSVAMAGLPRFRLSRQLGFTPMSDGRMAFVMPNRTITSQAEGGGQETVAFRPQFENAAFLAYTMAGESQDWHNHVAPLMTNRVFRLGIYLGLAAPFMEPAGLDNVLMHFVGQTTAGKTAWLQMIGSLFGCGSDPQHTSKATLVERWNATKNALELYTATHSGVFLLVDELGSNEEELLSAYNVTAGRGKARMDKVGGMRQQLRWTLYILSTGEIRITDKIEESTRKRPKGGSIIRAMDFNFDKLSDWGEMTSEERDRVVRAAKHAFGETTYGHLGPEFVQAVLDTYPTEAALRIALREEVEVRHAQLCAAAREHGYVLLPPHVRAIRRLALVAVVGNWARDFLGVTPEQVDADVQAAALTWLEELPPLDEGDRIVAQVRDYVIRYQGQIINYDNSTSPVLPPQTRAIAHKDWVLFTESGFAEACEGTPPKVAAKALAAKGILHREASKLTSRHVLTRLGLPRAPYYAVILKRLLPDDELHLVGGDEAEDGPDDGENGSEDVEQALGDFPRL